MNPLLSICIPTYNRSTILKQVLNSIVEQSCFYETNDIEIIISDNCSTDDTFDVIKSIILKHKKKIIYNRNDKTVSASENFDIALKIAKGKFLKLNNDTLLFQEGVLKKITDLIKENIDKKPIIFFTNGNSFQKKTIENYYTFESFLKNSSYWVTWIGAFGIWRDDYSKINFTRAASLLLPQFDVLLQVFSWKKNSVIDNNSYFISLIPEKKGGYDFITVFADNYFQLLQIPLKRGDLKEKNFKKEQKKILFNFFLPWIVNIQTNPDKYYFDITGWDTKLSKYYSKYILQYFLFRCIFKTKWVKFKKYIKIKFRLKSV